MFRGEINGEKGFFILGRGVPINTGFLKKVKKLDIPYCDGVVLTKRLNVNSGRDLAEVYIFSKELKRLWRVNVISFVIVEIPLPMSINYAEYVEMREYSMSADIDVRISLVIDNEVWIFSNLGANGGNNTDHVGRFNLLRRG